MTAATSFGSQPVKIISAGSTATSDPAPIAIPTSAWASARSIIYAVAGHTAIRSLNPFDISIYGIAIETR